MRPVPCPPPLCSLSRELRYFRKSESALMRCLRIADGLNTITRRGEIGTSLPVLGLRPILWPFLRTTNEPKEDSFTVSPRSRQSVISLSTNSTNAADSVRERPTFWYTASHKSARVTVFPVIAQPQSRQSSRLKINDMCWITLGQQGVRSLIGTRRRPAGRSGWAEFIAQPPVARASCESCSAGLAYLIADPAPEIGSPLRPTSAAASPPR